MFIAALLLAAPAEAAGLRRAGLPRARPRAILVAVRAGTTDRASIVVDLGATVVLDLIAASFGQAKTSPTRTPDGGWTIERANDRMVVYPAKASDLLLEPLPHGYMAVFPEILGLRVDVAAQPEGGTRVTARLIRPRLGTVIASVAVDAIALLFGGVPFFYTVTHSLEMKQLHENRRAAKIRLLRLALEPLVPHGTTSGQGPFR